MKFDIHADLFRNGFLDERAWQDYRERLITLFRDSAEGRAVEAAGRPSGFAELLLEETILRRNVGPASMGPEDLRVVLFESLPKKLGDDPGAGAAAISELRAFFAFLRRGFSLPNAGDCLAVLDREAPDRLRTARAPRGAPREGRGA